MSFFVTRIKHSPTTYLNHHGPLDVTALVDGLVQVSLGVIGVLTHGDVGLVHVEGLDGLVQSPVVLNETRRM